MGLRERLYVMVADWQRDAILEGVPKQRLAHLNLGTNHHIYYPPQTSDEKQQYDVLFVGHFDPLQTYKHQVQFEQFDPQVQQVLLDTRDQLRTWILQTDADKSTSDLA